MAAAAGEEVCAPSDPCAGFPLAGAVVEIAAEGVATGLVGRRAAAAGEVVPACGDAVGEGEFAGAVVGAAALGWRARETGGVACRGACTTAQGCGSALRLAVYMGSLAFGGGTARRC